MKNRYLEPVIESLCFGRNKMAFVSGPRQSGKTTPSKNLLMRRDVGAYYNWDETQFRRSWAKNPNATLPLSPTTTPLVIYDEIHKAKLWKRTLKGLFDTKTTPIDIVVTGSARLNVYKKGSDSLLGRYYNFHLHPFSLRELNSTLLASSSDLIEKIFSRAFIPQPERTTQLNALMRFGGFPEPLLAMDENTARLWKKGRLEKVIREDLRDLSRIQELSQIEILASLLPDKVGSPFSHNSVREDLETSFPTVKRWMTSLKELYYIFEIKPYSKSIVRSLSKSGKIYLWDYSEVNNEAARFENLIANHLLKACHYWNERGETQLELFYLRDKFKNEIDFLLTKDRKPFLPIEVKLNDTTPVASWTPFLHQLGLSKGIQVIKTSGVWQIKKINSHEILVCSADELLNYFV